MNDSVMSKHLDALASSGYLTISKASHSGRRTTWVASSAAGRRVAALRVMIADVPCA